MVPLAFGTQTGGSTIRPAAFCGIVGYKPSFGTINRAGLKFVAESLDTIGVMARTVEDCALLVHAVSARPAARSRKRRLSQRAAYRLLQDLALERSVIRDAHRARDGGIVSRAQGRDVQDLALPPDFDRLYDEQELIMNFEAARSLADERFRYGELLSDHCGRSSKNTGTCRALATTMRCATLANADSLSRGLFRSRCAAHTERAG